MNYVGSLKDVVCHFGSSESDWDTSMCVVRHLSLRDSHGATDGFY